MWYYEKNGKVKESGGDSYLSSIIDMDWDVYRVLDKIEKIKAALVNELKLSKQDNNFW